MPRSRFFLKGLIKLCVAVAIVVGAVAGYRRILDPLIDSAFHLGPHASSIVRRLNIFIALVLSYWTFARAYERRAPQELLIRSWWTLLGAVAGALSIGVTILALYATGHYELVSLRDFHGIGDIFGLIWIAAVIEEVVFRGILFRIAEEEIGTRGALFLSAGVFSVAHVTNTGFRWITLISVTLAGLMWALVFLIWRNIWVVAAHHCCWNATIFLTGLPLSGEDWHLQAPLATVSHGSILWTGGAFGPEDSVLNIAVSIVICVALWRMARHARYSPNDSASPSARIRTSSS